VREQARRRRSRRMQVRMSHDIVVVDSVATAR
jgi:hypothetical protein